MMEPYNTLNPKKEKGRLPDFLIIGAMKCGTTSLHDYLGKHPDIFTSKIKEIHYFVDSKYQKYDLDWYKAQFVTNKKIAGAAPQNYTKSHNKYYQNIPPRIKQYLPEVKLIYILRDPIERYKSHILENYYGDPPDDIYYNLESDHYLKTGLYYMQLQAYLPYFPLEQIHILTLEDLKEDRLNTLNKVFRFLGVKELKNEELFDFISNAHKDKKGSVRFHYSRKINFVRQLAPLLFNKVLRKKIISNFLFGNGRKKHLSTKEEKRLREIYQKDVDQLRTLTGLKFDKWSV